MAERYDVVLDGQLGERRGTLTWTETDRRLTGTFTLFGIDNPVIGRRSGAVLELTHTLRTAVSLLRSIMNLFFLVIADRGSRLMGGNGLMG